MSSASSGGLAAGCVEWAGGAGRRQVAPTGAAAMSTGRGAFRPGLRGLVTLFGTAREGGRPSTESILRLLFFKPRLGPQAHATAAHDNLPCVRASSPIRPLVASLRAGRSLVASEALAASACMVAAVFFGAWSAAKVRAHGFLLSTSVAACYAPTRWPPRDLSVIYNSRDCAVWRTHDSCFTLASQLSWTLGQGFDFDMVVVPRTGSGIALRVVAQLEDIARSMCVHVYVCTGSCRPSCVSMNSYVPDVVFTVSCA